MGYSLQCLGSCALQTRPCCFAYTTLETPPKIFCLRPWRVCLLRGVLLFQHYECTNTGITVAPKPGSQFDASASVALQALGDVWIDLISIPALHCQRPTNQIVKKFYIRDIIWLVKKTTLIPVTLMMLTHRASVILWTRLYTSPSRIDVLMRWPHNKKVHINFYDVHTLCTNNMYIIYLLDQTLRLLFISSMNFVQLLFKSGDYSRATFISLSNPFTDVEESEVA